LPDFQEAKKINLFKSLLILALQKDVEWFNMLNPLY
jgi:hypothetical protein